MVENIQIILASAAFAFAVLLAAALYFSNVHWMGKALIILASLGVALSSYMFFTRALGFPVRGNLPDEVKVLSFLVEEPSRAKNNNGRILVWYLDTDTNLPRAVIRPYSKSLHKAFGEMEARGQQGGKIKRREGPEGEARNRGAHDSLAERGEDEFTFEPPGSPFPSK